MQDTSEADEDGRPEQTDEDVHRGEQETNGEVTCAWGMNWGRTAT